MKVIARQKYGYVVEVTKTEMEHLTGARENYADCHTHSEGAVVEVSKAWHSLRPIVAAPNDIKRQAEALRGIATILEAASSLVERTQLLTPDPPAAQ